MAWALRFHPAVRKDLRRLPKEARNFIPTNVLPMLGRNPYGGEPLHGPLKGFWKYQSGEYRVAYAVDEKRHEVIVLEVGPRGGFYERLRRRLRK